MEVRLDLAGTSRQTRHAISARPFDIALSGLLVALQLAQSLVKGFLRELLAGAEPQAARIMSMSARRAAGTCRRPG